MEYDLVIRDGLIVDGSGGPGRRGDVGVVGDRIVEVGEVDGIGREEFDAGGLVVAPGFVDAHVHMDAQVFWDDLGTSSCWHGVTTVAMGNCGFTLAPAAERDKALVVRNLERAEDIAGEAMEQGITWTWSTFSEYLDAVDDLPKGINYAAAVGHSALRTWAMGERAFEEPGSEEDLLVMKRELSDALRAGASGFTTSRSWAHTTTDGRPVASRLATWEEVVELVELVGRESTGTFELANAATPTSTDDERRAYYESLEQLAVASGVPVTFGLFAAGMPHALPVMEHTAARGGHMYGLTHCRGVYSVQSFHNWLCFDHLPEWAGIRGLPLPEQRTLLQNPDVRARLVHAAHGIDVGGEGPQLQKPDYDKIEIMYSAYLPNPTVAEEARRRGADPVDVMIDVALEHDFDIFFIQMLTPQKEDDLLTLMRSPFTAMTFSDSGAHVGQFCDASIQSHLLAYWVRERQAFTMEEAVRMITHQPAKVWRLHDRGMLAPGFAADITIFDADTVAPSIPRVVNDLPGGARRIVQQADGYAATFVNGQMLMRDGEATDVRSGRLLRQPPPDSLVAPSALGTNGASSHEHALTDLVGLPEGGFRLDGCTALITGGSRNIGANIALGYVQAGADVIIVARDVGRLEDVAARLRAEAPERRVLTIPADVSNRSDTDRVIETALETCGTVHVLVNNAAANGMAGGTEIQDTTDDVWDEVYETNILAPYRLIRGFAPAMVAAGAGSVINVLSGSGFQPIVGEGRCAYGTSKAALWMMTKYLAADLAPTIRVNGLVPGSISPDGEIHYAAHQRRISAIPFGRVGRPDELVGAAIYLASPAASYTSGTLLFCNGARLW